MGTRSLARSRARWAWPFVASPARRAMALPLALVLALASGCGDASLDGLPAAPADATTSTTGTLPPLDTGEASSTDAASSGEPPIPDDPRLCADECAIVLPPRWTYEATPPPPPSPRAPAPRVHAMPAMLRDADGTLTVAELVDGAARLHRLDGEGRLQWNVPLPLPCDPCELTDVARHPSGDLLLSATGVDAMGELALLALRYDAVRHASAWQSRRPLVPLEGVHARSGGIAALPDDVVAQLYLRPQLEFDVLQRTLVVAYDGTDGTLIEEEELRSDTATRVRPPLLARATADGQLLIAIFGGSDAYTYGLVDRIAPPLWQHTGFASPPAALDDVVLDAASHSLELGQSFDGVHTYLLLSERADVDAFPRWTAGLALPSTTTSPGALAIGPDGDVYAAVRTTQAPGGTPEPLVGLSLSRWTPDGELRFHTTLLLAVAESFHPLGLAVDDDEGLVLAAVIDGRLRVERREQGCGCGS